MSADLQAHVVGTLAKIVEPLELDRWNIQAVNGPSPDSRAWSAPAPEYREAVIGFDFEKLKTGDDLTETVVHETSHCHTGPLHDLAIQLADAVADLMPEYARDGVRKLLQERVRFAAETVTTDVGYAYLRLLRRAGILDTPAASV